jgi:hypothetical protein
MTSAMRGAGVSLGDAAPLRSRSLRAVLSMHLGHEFSQYGRRRFEVEFCKHAACRIGREVVHLREQIRARNFEGRRTR